MAKEKKVKPPKPPKPEKVKKEKKAKEDKTPGRGRTAVAVIALILALIGVGGGAYFGYSQWQTAQQAAQLAKEDEANKQRIAALEEAAALEKNRENVVIQMSPHAVAAYMADSAHLYQTKFSGVRYESSPEAGSLVKLRVPVSVTIFNNGDQTVTIKSAALYPWETIFEEGFRQENLAAQQENGFFGELAQGQRDSFSVPPGESVTIEIDAKLRGVYSHPAFEAETQRFFMDYYANTENEVPDPEEDSAIEGKGIVNGRVNYLFRQALGFYCAQRSTRFTLTYAIQTERGNAFSATCVVPF